MSTFHGDFVVHHETQHDRVGVGKNNGGAVSICLQNVGTHLALFSEVNHIFQQRQGNGESVSPIDLQNLRAKRTKGHEESNRCQRIGMVLL